MTLENLKDVKKELQRFEKKLDDCLVRIATDSFALQGCKETGAVKRGALDLKNELTKITKT